MRKNKHYEISDMFNGKVTCVNIHGKKIKLFKPTPFDEVVEICDRFFNTIDFSSVVKTPKEIIESRKSVMDDSDEPKLKILDGKYGTISIYKEPIVEMRNDFGTHRFDKNDMLKIIKKYYPKSKNPLKMAITYMSYMRREGIVDKRGRTQSSFIKLTPDIDEEHLKKMAKEDMEIRKDLLK